MTPVLGLLLGCPTPSASPSPDLGAATPPPPPAPAPAPAPAPTATRSATGEQAFAAADRAHHCAGEGGEGDEERTKFLVACIDEATRQGRELLPKLTDADLPPRELAAVRLYLDPNLSDADKRAACAALGAEDLPDTLLDDEVRLATCGVLGN